MPSQYRPPLSKQSIDRLYARLQEDPPSANESPSILSVLRGIGMIFLLLLSPFIIISVAAAPLLAIARLHIYPNGSSLGFTLLFGLALIGYIWMIIQSIKDENISLIMRIRELIWPTLLSILLIINLITSTGLISIDTEFPNYYLHYTLLIVILCVGLMDWIGWLHQHSHKDIK